MQEVKGTNRRPFQDQPAQNAHRRIAVLWFDLSGYLNACLRSLAAVPGVSLFVAHRGSYEHAPYAEEQFEWIKNRFQWGEDFNADDLIERLRVFEPDTIVICGWTQPGYRKAAKRFKGKAVRIMTTDTPWRNTPKQRVGAIVSRAYIQPLADTAWVPGERQAIFAKKIGFTDYSVMRGLYSCDQGAFASHARFDDLEKRRCFVYVGRFAHEKGITLLIRAYRHYRNVHPDPWPIRCYGTGPLEEILNAQPGIEVYGFTQPNALPAELAKTSCLVLPSVIENWGVVLHEATSVGIAVVASEQAGSAVHLLQDGLNGYLINPTSLQEFSHALMVMSSLCNERLVKMCRASLDLSKQYTPDRWATYLLEKSAFLLNVKHRPAEY